MRAEILFSCIEPGTERSIKELEVAMGKVQGRHQKQGRKAATLEKQKLEAPRSAGWLRAAD